MVAIVMAGMDSVLLCLQWLRVVVVVTVEKARFGGMR